MSTIDLQCKNEHRAKKVGKGKTISSSPGWCHICGFRIPNNIVTPFHPLFGTIDHLIPFSRGGKDSYANRKAAHFECNQIKSSHFPVPHALRMTCQVIVVRELKRLGEKVSKADWHMADERIEGFLKSLDQDLAEKAGQSVSSSTLE